MQSTHSAESNSFDLSEESTSVEVRISYPSPIQSTSAYGQLSSHKNEQNLSQGSGSTTKQPEKTRQQSFIKKLYSTPKKSPYGKSRENESKSTTPSATKSLNLARSVNAMKSPKTPKRSQMTSLLGTGKLSKVEKKKSPVSVVRRSPRITPRKFEWEGTFTSSSRVLLDLDKTMDSDAISFNESTDTSTKRDKIYQCEL